MRLKTKILLISCVLMAAAIALCCFFILRHVYRQQQSDALEQAIADFSACARKLTQIDTAFPSATVEQSYMIYRLRELETEDEWTLCKGGTYLVNNCGFSPEAFLPDMQQASLEPQTCYATVARQPYLLLGIVIGHTYGDYTVCMVRDMRALQTSVTKLTRQCLWIGGGVLLVFLLLVYSLTALSLKPIETLQSGANAIAGGQYDTRIPIRKNDEIGLLAADFNAMADAVQKSIADLKEENARKQAFINDLSHELKTPVTSLLLNSDTLLTRTVSDDSRQRALLRIHEQAKWIERLSQKLMKLVLLQGSIERTPCSAHALFDAVQETVADSLQASDMQLQTVCGDEVFVVDFDLMRSALVNLIENAIKASQPGSVIELFADRNELSVRDHGCGIPDAELSRITEPFYMVDRSRSKKKGGSGLGLALVKEIAAAHGASLLVESALGEGTTVTIRFFEEN